MAKRCSSSKESRFAPSKRTHSFSLPNPTLKQLCSVKSKTPLNSHIAIASPCHGAAPARPQTRPARIEPHSPFNPCVSEVIRGFKYNHQTTLAPAQVEPRPHTKNTPSFVYFVSFVDQKHPHTIRDHPRPSVVSNDRQVKPAQVELRPPISFALPFHSHYHFIRPPIPFALPSLATLEGPPEKCHRKMRQPPRISRPRADAAADLSLTSDRSRIPAGIFRSQTHCP